MLKSVSFFYQLAKRDNYMGMRFAPLPLLLLLICLSVPAFANQYFPNIDEDLSYEYSFSQKYIVAGERVLNINISNNTDNNIKAMEFEIRLKSAFGDVISDWSIFVDPDLQIPAHTSKSLTLTLTKRSIFGAKLENVLDQAKYIDLRYKRILLDNDALLSQRDLYPELSYNYGPFKIELDIINNKKINDPKKYSFFQATYSESSIAYDLSVLKRKDESKRQYFDERRKFDYIDQIVDIFSKDCLILLAKITNISKEPQEKDWLPSSGYGLEPPVFILVDDKDNQYNQPSLAYTPSGWWRIATGRQVLCPDVTFFIIYVFDKIDGYTPKKLKVYVDEQEYYKTFLLTNAK